LLDPDNAFGVPFGGYGRDTRSRLAALPLFLPHATADLQEQLEQHVEPLHAQIRDADGRLYACRVYHEDELEPDSLLDGGGSLFDPPRLRVEGREYPSPEDLKKRKAESDEDKKKKQELLAAGTEAAKKHLEAALEEARKKIRETGVEAEVAIAGQDLRIEFLDAGELGEDAELQEALREAVARTVEQINQRQRLGNVVGTSGSSTTTMSSRAADATSREKLAVADIENRLAKLDGLCGHIHLGWWSYEWCYMDHVSQFHLHADEPDKSKGVDGAGTKDSTGAATTTVRITDPTLLGRFESRSIETDLSLGPVNPLAEDAPELARVLEIHTGGDVCQATGKPRTSKVQLICCSNDVMTGRKGRMLRMKDSEVTQDERFYAVIHGVREDPNKICTYVVTVCTPILCGEEQGVKAGSDPHKSVAVEGSEADTAAAVAQEKNTGPKENESVREIIDRTLGEHCLQANTGGWWTYEFCHGGLIRQYHEEIRSTQKDGGQTVTETVVDSEHLLGKYQREESESFPNEDEWKHVVNATATKDKGRKSPVVSGNGAYFQLEYKDGDVCDHTDVTDAAVVAGGVTKNAAKIARAASVRYYCGEVFFVNVNEDTTCHYIVDVTIPDLCEHSLFKAPVTKQQLFKCLPVEEDQSVGSEYPILF